MFHILSQQSYFIFIRLLLRFTKIRLPQNLISKQYDMVNDFSSIKPRATCESARTSIWEELRFCYYYIRFDTIYLFFLRHDCFLRHIHL